MKKGFCLYLLNFLTAVVLVIIVHKTSIQTAVSFQFVSFSGDPPSPPPPPALPPPPASPRPPPRIALILFGILDRYDPNFPQRTPPPHNVSLPQSFASIQRHIIAPSQEKGYAVDIFAHSWNWEEKDLIDQVYQPNASLFEASNHTHRYMFDSIESALILRRNFERDANVTYDWVLVMRHDIFFYNQYDVTGLNDQLFYLSNWCIKKNIPETVRKQWGSQHGTAVCDAMEVFRHDTRHGVPDMVFAGSPTNVDRVFLNLEQDHRDGKFKSSASVNAHAKAGGRIFSMNDEGLLQIGRYKVHFMDYTILRYWTETQETFANRPNGLWLHPNEYNLTEQHVHSQCSDRARYCYNESYAKW